MDTRSANQDSYFSRLPDEMLVKVLFDLALADAENISQAYPHLDPIIQDIWKRRYQRHFPLHMKEAKKINVTNWPKQFSDHEEVAYRSFQPVLKQLFYLVKEHNPLAIMSEELELNDLLTADISRHSLLSMSLQSGNKILLNHLYKIATEFFKHDTEDNAIDPDALDSESHTLLHWAIYCAQSLEVIQALIAQGCDTNARSINGETSLILAVKYHRLDLMLGLLEGGALTDEQDLCGQTALFIAAKANHPDIVMALLAFGADINRGSLGDGPPLCLAARAGRLEMVKMLVANGANINADYLGATPLHFAAENAHLMIVNYLLSQHANTNPLRADLATPLFSAITSKNIEVIKALLLIGTNVNAADIWDNTPLYYAMRSENTDIAELLFEYGAKVNQVCGNGENALFSAIVANDLEMVKLLIPRKIKINIANEDEGITPLHVAIQNGHYDIFIELLNHGANLNTVALRGASPLFIAGIYGHLDFIKELLSRGANVALAEENNKYKMTLLYVAAINGRVDIADTLIMHGVDINEPCVDGRTALYMAVKRGHLDLAKFLLAHCANPNQPNIYGRTPLHVAASVGNLAMVKLLLSYHANPERVIIRSQKTPLQAAVNNGHLEVASVINVYIDEIVRLKKKAETRIHEKSFEDSKIELIQTRQPSSRLHGLFGCFKRSATNSDENLSQHSKGNDHSNFIVDL